MESESNGLVSMIESISLDQEILLRRIAHEAPNDVLMAILAHAAPSVPMQGKARRDFARRGAPFEHITFANMNLLRSACKLFRNAVDSLATSLIWKPGQHLPNDAVVSLPNLRDPQRISHISHIKVLLCPHLSSLKSLHSAPTSLEEIDISGCGISSLEPLRECHRLRKLDASHTSIIDLSPLSSSSNTLTMIDINNTRVSDLSPLADCHCLLALDCSRCICITDLGPLAQGPSSSLEILHCYSTSIKSCLPLAKCSRLKELWADKGIKHLDELKQALPNCQM